MLLRSPQRLYFAGLISKWEGSAKGIGEDQQLSSFQEVTSLQNNIRS